MQCLVQGSHLPLLKGTITSLTLSSPSWKIPLALYEKGHLLRLSSLHLNKIRIGTGKDLEHLLTSHAPTLRQLYLNSVHLPNLPSWRSLLMHISRMDRLHQLELKLLFSTSARSRKPETYFPLPRSTPVSTMNMASCRERKWEIDKLTTATTPQEIGLFIDSFFTDTGELQRDFGEQLLGVEQGTRMQTMKRRLGLEDP